jgi:phospholipid/cholesterol/gamma-HCH transport system substrate-binding protein
MAEAVSSKRGVRGSRKAVALTVSAVAFGTLIGSVVVLCPGCVCIGFASGDDQRGFVPSQQEVQWSQLKVGVLVIVALVALTALIFLMSGSSGGLFVGKITLRSYFENAAGLKVGAPVNLEGVTIGNVKKINIVPSRKLTPVEVIMKVSTRFTADVREDSKSSLDTVGVLGDTVVDIDSKRAIGPRVKDNDELGTNESPNLSDVIKSSQGTIEQVNTILAKLDSLVDSLNTGKGSIGQLINDPGLYNRANETVTELAKLSTNLSQGKGTIGKLLNDDTLYNHFNDTAARLDHITAEIDNGQGSIGKLLKDKTLYDNLNQTVTNANALIAQINQGKGTIGMLAKDPEFQAKFRDSIDKLDSIMDRINSGQGTIGQLVQNPSLYNNADAMLSESRNLVTQIRENPKKYLTFHVKIF